VLLTHSIDVTTGWQTCAPISIGEYCCIGTNSVILGGAVLPSFCVVGVMSLLNKRLEEPYRLYAGVPARPVKTLEPNSGYFTRSRGRAF
jgi:acetyltransferase-like isoleucine patch superfamily enzyme